MNQGHFTPEMLEELNKYSQFGSIVKRAYLTYSDDKSFNVLSLVIKPSTGGKNNFFHIQDLGAFTQISGEMFNVEKFDEVVFQIWTDDNEE